MANVSSVGVIGAGSWGSAFAQILSDAGSDVVLWGRDKAVVQEINESHTNQKFHPGRVLPSSIVATAQISQALASEVIVLAIPTQTLRENLRAWVDLAPTDAPIVSLLKGLEVSSTRRVSEIVGDEWQIGSDRFAMVTGPNLAGEIIAREPAAGVVASTSAQLAKRIQSLSSAPYFRPYTTDDVVGCEIAGIGKNVIALSVGMAVGLGMGDNTKATVITRGLAEISRLGAAMGADPATFAGLAGLGDLVATCSSPLSRNRSFGERLGQGLSLIETQAATSTTAEAVKSAAPLLELAHKFRVDMPITEAVVEVVNGRLKPPEAVRLLMGRTKKSE